MNKGRVLAIVVILCLISGGCNTVSNKPQDDICKLPYLTSNDDLNNFLEPGRWVAISSINSPDPSDTWLFEVEKYVTDRNAGGWLVQKCSKAMVDGRFQSYIRNAYIMDKDKINFGQWVRVDNNGLGYGKLNGSVIVNFGDSIIGAVQGSTSVSGYIAYLTNATVYNAGFGGCRMSVHEPNWDAFSMYRIADAIVTHDFSYQDNAIKANDPSMPQYFVTTLETLKTIDFTKVDYITITYGTNDYTAGKEIINPANEEDLNTYSGALRYSLRRIYEAYPNLKVLVCTPGYMFWSDKQGHFIEDSDTKTFNAHHDTMDAFVVATERVAKEFKTPCLDQYYEFGINKYNRLQYFTPEDGTHPQDAGRLKMAQKISSALMCDF